MKQALFYAHFTDKRQGTGALITCLRDRDKIRTRQTGPQKLDNGHHHLQDVKHVHHNRKCLQASLQSVASPPWSRQPLMFSCHCHSFPHPRISYKQNHILCVFLCPTSSAHQNVFKIRSGCCSYHWFVPFYSYIVPYGGDSPQFGLSTHCFMDIWVVSSFQYIWKFSTYKEKKNHMLRLLRSMVKTHLLSVKLLNV